MEIQSLLSVFHFILWSVYAIVVMMLALYVPGSLVLGKRSGVVFAISVGLILWSWQGVILGYLGLRMLTYVYLGICFFLWIRKTRPQRTQPFPIRFTLTKYHWIVVAIFAVGVFGQTNRFIPTGFIFPQGVYIFTPAADDAFWHGSLTNQLVKNFPPQEPGLFGIPVTNYHYWSNMVIAEFTRVFGIPVLLMQFVYAPIFMSLLFGAISFLFMTDLGISGNGKILGLWMLYFASDVNYLISFVMRKQIVFTVHPLEDGTMFWENPPRAVSYVVTIIGIVLLLRWIKKGEWQFGLLAALAFGSVIGYKVHTGIMVLGAVAGLGAFLVWKRDVKRLWMPLATFLVALFVYLPVNSNSGLPVFVPFEMSRMYAVQEKLGLSFLELRRRIYTDHFNYLRQWQMDLTMLAIFLIGQFGIRNVGWLGFGTIMRRSSHLGFLIIGGILSSLILGTFFIQPVAGADIFNAYLATSLFLWIGSFFVLDRWMKKMSVVTISILLLVIAGVTIPRWIYKTYLPFAQLIRSKSVIWSDEVNAMKYIHTYTQHDEVIAVFNTGQWDSMFPYVSIYTNHPMYLSGQTILERHGIKFVNRSDRMKMLTSFGDVTQIRAILQEEGISILYFYGRPKLGVAIESLKIEKVFSNDSIWVYRYTDYAKMNSKSTL